MADHWERQDEYCHIARGIDRCECNEARHKIDTVALSYLGIPTCVHGPALEGCREEAGDQPASLNSPDGVKRIRKGAVAGGEYPFVKI